AAGREPLPRRHLEDVAAIQPERALDGAFSERRRPDDDGPVVVLERAGHALGGGGRPLVDQDDEGDVRRDGRAVRAVDDLSRAAFPLPGDGRARREEEPGDRDRLIDDPAAVPAEIQDEPGRALIDQASYGVAD